MTILNERYWLVYQNGETLVEIKKIISKASRFLSDPEQRFKFFSYHDLYKNLSDKEYLERLFPLRVGYELNLDNPKTFNEKIQWLKVYDHNPIYTTMVDKYLVKDYIARIIDEEYIIPTLGVWEKFEEIEFDKLPNCFVLKCTHDSGGVIIVDDKSKLNIKDTRRKLEKSLKRNFYWHGREWAYKDVKPRIIAEKYLGFKTKECDDIMDYKLMCFNGKVKCSFVCSGRASGSLKVTFFDTEWNAMPFERHYPKSCKLINQPKSWDRMVKLAEKISMGYPFMRIDFYEVGGALFFGEITLYPGDGFEEFSPLEWDYELGGWISLPLV